MNRIKSSHRGVCLVLLTVPLLFSFPPLRTLKMTSLFAQGRSDGRGNDPCN
jgi:hypothetical protein